MTASDVFLRNARISGVPQRHVDISILDGVIAEITPVSSHPGDNPTGAEVIDAGGRWVSPGLWDNHVHFSQWALVARRLDLSTAASARECADRVAAALARSAPPHDGEPFIGSGFRDALWPDAPALDILDAAGGGLPVVLVSGDLHAVWLNSAALALYADPQDQSLTGLIRENPAFDIIQRINVAPDAALDAWADQAGRAAAARGVVGIVDFEMDWNLEVWQRRMAGGFDSLRVEFGIYTEHLERALDAGLRTGRPVGPLLTVGRYKVLIDGSLNTRTAYCYDEYPGLEHSDHRCGILTVPTDELGGNVLAAARGGIEPAVHAIGDHAVSLALDAFEVAGGAGRIEHAQLISNPDLLRFAALNVTASVQPDHAMDDRDVAEIFWAGRNARSFPLRTLLDSGATLALGSDAPVSPLDPWLAMAAAVWRRREERDPWHPEQCISMQEALVASTRNTVAVGQVADIIVTEIDPLVMTLGQVTASTVALTLLGGRTTHSALMSC